ncbi:glycosyltransferase family 39 protein, partial [Candidatus Woesearchaeota archaeon]|nr:glycosyltransferase family 39 protein [Candidatus Woesearchaeota archaeon]
MWLEMRLKRKHIHILIIILLCAIIYSNTFFSGFVFDDKFFIQDNFRIRSLSNIPSFFRVPGTGNLYRPIRETLYSITFFFWGLNPFGYHMNAVLLHTLISVLAYLIIFQVTGDRRLSLIASLLFAAHPIHTARVANMTAGFDLLGILFLFWSFYLFTLFRRKGSGRYLAYSLIVFTLGLFSSEEAAMLPLLALWYDACFIGGKGVFGRSPARYLKKKARQFWPFIAPLGIYIFARFFVLRQIGRAEVYFLGSLRTRVFSTMVIFLRYIYIMAFPLNLTVSYDVKQYSSLFSLGMLLALLAYALIIFFWLKLRRSDKPAFFSVGWFFIALIPFSNIFPVHTFMADRYLYSASFGFALFSACIIFDVLSIRADKRTLKAAFMVIAVFLIVSYSALAIARNREWKSDDELLSRAVERQPESSTAHNDLGQAYE